MPQPQMPCEAMLRATVALLVMLVLHRRVIPFPFPTPSRGSAIALSLGRQRSTSMAASSGRSLLRRRRQYPKQERNDDYPAVENARVVIIGGGAAGYFAAIECARTLNEDSVVQTDVLVLEADAAPLSKVLISGGGRCNVMHDPMKGADRIAEGYPRGHRELLGPLNTKFGPWETYDWFLSRLEMNGMRLKTESDGRVFPSSDSSSSIAQVLQEAATNEGVCIKCRVKATAVSVDAGNDRYFVQYTDEAGNGTVACDAIIMATGSSRLGHKILRTLGHDVGMLLPSLFSFKLPTEPALSALAGISNQYTRVRLVVDKQLTEKTPMKALLRGLQAQAGRRSGGHPLTQYGPLLITKQGLSGPAVLKLSAFGSEVAAALSYSFTIEVNFLADIEADELMEVFRAFRRRYPHRKVGKAFPKLPHEMIEFIRQTMQSVGITESADHAASSDASNEAHKPSGRQGTALVKRRLWLFLLERAGVDPEIRWVELTDGSMHKIAKQVTSCLLTVNGRGSYREEFVTCGGVQLNEIDINTMQSKHRARLFLCGEILDIDGITGGYNFQSAWTTGFIAGRSCAEILRQDNLLSQQPIST